MNRKIIYEVEQLDGHCLSLAQLSRCTQMDEGVIIQLVESEVLCPLGDDRSELLFSAEDLSRLSRAGRLMHEFELTPVGLALVFELLEELRALRQLT